MLAQIGACGFDYCKGLIKIKLPSLTQMGNYTFVDCDKLKEIDLPSLSQYGKNLFRNSKCIEIAKIPSKLAEFKDETLPKKAQIYYLSSSILYQFTKFYKI